MFIQTLKFQPSRVMLKERRGGGEGVVTNADLISLK